MGFSKELISQNYLHSWRLPSSRRNRQNQRSKIVVKCPNALSVRDQNKAGLVDGAGRHSCYYNRLVRDAPLIRRHLRKVHNAQLVKNLLAVQEKWVQSLDWEDPLKKEMAIHSNNLTWEIPWTEELDGLQGVSRVGHNLATEPPPQDQ